MWYILIGQQFTEHPTLVMRGNLFLYHGLLSCLISVNFFLSLSLISSFIFLLVDWQRFVRQMGDKWYGIIDKWLDKDPSIHITYYEDIIADTRTELEKMLRVSHACMIFAVGMRQ